MSKIRVLGCAVIAVFALSAIAASGASATLWLSNGKSLLEAQNATIHLKLVFRHTGGTTGNGEFECSMLLVGTVGPSNRDLVSLVESLNGAERDLISCHLINGLTTCETIIVHPLNLSWLTLLELINNQTWDHFEPEPGQTAQPGWDVLCKILGVERLVIDCVGLQRLRFISNGTNGAEFEYEGAESGEEECSDGGTSVDGKGSAEVLGYTVS